MTDLTKLEKLRPCGRLETYSTARHHLGIYNNVGFTATYHTTEIPSAPIESTVFTALRHVILTHPVLSAIPLNEDQSFPAVYFARLPEIDLRTCVDIRERRTDIPEDGQSDEELDGLLAEQHARSFKEDVGTRPFWRVVVLKPKAGADVFTISWFFHHALADGVSALLFHEAFLAGLEKSVLKTDASPLVASSTAPLLPSLETLHPMSISWSFFLPAILAAILPSFFNKRPAKLWTGKPIPSTINPPPQPKYRTLVFSAETSSTLVQLGREQGVSVTATLHCLVASSLFASLPPNEYDKLKIEGPTSVRKFLDALNSKPNQMTNAVAQYAFLHTRPSEEVESPQNQTALHTFSWDEARSVKSTIQTELAKKGNDSPIALLKYISDMQKYFQDKLGQPRSASAEISNVGVWKNNSRSEVKWSVGRMVFSQYANVVGYPFAVNAVTGGDQNLVLNFCWYEGAIDGELMAKVIDGVYTRVKHLANEKGN